MANQVLRLYVDTATRRLVKSTTSTEEFAALKFYQGDTVTLVITLLEPNASGGITAPYSKVDVTGLTCRVGIGTPTAGTGSGAPGIFQNSFTLDETLNTLTGTLYITPSTVASLLGTATSGTSTFEVEIAESGNYTTVYQGNCTVYAELIEGAASAPTPTDTYMTANESLATFARQNGTAGQSITLTSPDGTKRVILYIDDDGLFHSDVTTV